MRFFGENRLSQYMSRDYRTPYDVDVTGGVYGMRGNRRTFFGTEEVDIPVRQDLIDRMQARNMQSQYAQNDMPGLDVLSADLPSQQYVMQLPASMQAQQSSSAAFWIVLIVVLLAVVLAIVAMRKAKASRGTA